MQTHIKKGLASALGSFTLWGFLPIYWKLLEGVPALEILANRILWAFVLMAVLIAATGRWKQIRTVLGNPRELAAIVLASLLIAVNWGLFIWAVTSGRILETSLGYYINPLIAIAMGVFLFKEKLSGWNKFAIALAAAGVLVKTLRYGAVPWVSLGLAVSFALYGYFKKSAKVGSIVGLALETALLAPLAGGFLLALQLSGKGALFQGAPLTSLLLLGAGAATAIPLLLYAAGARRLPMSVLGFSQYISPTISLFLGIFLYHEPFHGADLAGFALIWIALGIYSFTTFRTRGNLEEGVGEMENMG